MADYKILTIPFARDAVPDMVNDIPNDPSIAEPQLASFKQGFPSITTIPLVAGGIPPEGQDFNGILRDITEHIVHQNKGGMYKFEADIVAAGGYPKGAVLSANDGLSLWVSLQNNNVQDFNGPTKNQWARIAFSGLDSLLNSKVDKTSIVHSTGVSTTSVMSQNAVTLALAGVDKFNAAAVTVASASTVDLTTAAPNTSQIVISGTAAINGFTVAAERAFVVKFSGDCTLVNGASLVTGTGGNIAVTAGSTCIIRATAANVVEVVGYVESSLIGTKVTAFAKTLLDDADAAAARATLDVYSKEEANGIAIGVGQTWQDVTASRSAGTTYTNTTGRPIQLSVTFDPIGHTTHFQVNDVGVLPSNDVGYYHVFCVVPAGATYRLGSIGSVVNLKWAELR